MGKRAKKRAYLDIETTGFSRNYYDITVVGAAVERKGQLELTQLIGSRITKSGLLRVLKGVDEIYTYNGSRFDLPFIETRIGINLKGKFCHRDLMYDCWKKKLKGGLKAVERRLRIKRKLTDIDGYMAVRLWWDYVNNNDRESLQTLLKYNAEDVLNLQVLRRRLGIR
jgi:uncharacterized protein YprB with RNaseH-like and TPR domain